MPPECPAGLRKHTAVIYTRENEFSSIEYQRSGRAPFITRNFDICLPPSSAQLQSEFILVKSSLPIEEQIRCPINAGLGRSLCFSYRASFTTLDPFMKFLAENLGIDLRLWSMQRRKPRLPLPVNVNLLNMVNAYYDPSVEELFFGDGQRKVPFGQEGDVVVHEATHWVVDTLNPLLSEAFYEFGATIHEGLADTVASLYIGDPESGEDTAIFDKGRADKDGVRNANNRLKLTDLIGRGPDSEADPHIVGQVYSGFFWSLAERFEKMLNQRAPAMAFTSGGQEMISPLEGLRKPDLSRNRNLALDAAMKIALAHVLYYAPTHPSHEDFPAAAVAASQALYDEGVLPELSANRITRKEIEAMIMEESKARSFDTYSAEVCAARPEAPIPAGTTFEAEPKRLAAIGADEINFYRQTYRTQTRGMAPVLRHGKMERKLRGGAKTQSARGVLRLPPGSVDETVSKTQAEAFGTAMLNLNAQVRAVLSRHHKRVKSEPEISWIVDSLKKALTAKGTGTFKLAVLAKKSDAKSCGFGELEGKGALVWHADIGNTEVMIDAKTGAIAEFRLKMIVS